MICIYAYSTPNSVKVPIMLEEIGIDYSIHSIDLRKGEQTSDSFDLEKAPNVQRWMRNLEERQAFRRGIERTAALSA
jgi:glutathione S-transferase